MSDYLPEDIIVRILVRLPSKSLIKLSCLSKFWNRIILSDPHFARSQFQRASLQQTLTSRLLFKGDSYGIKLDSLEMEAPRVRNKMHPTFLNGSSGVRFLSFNGLVCLLLDYWGETRLYIWNPTTGVNKEFPCPPRLDHYVNVNCFGFGYVSATDEYKVFVSVIIQEDGVEREDLNTLSLRAADTFNWKKIEAPNPFGVYGDATLVHEALHWVHAHNIVVFDLYSERFRTMPLPSNNLGYFPFLALGPSLGGCLCLMSSSHPLHSAELWVMREYDAADSWTRQFTMSNVIPGRLVLATETTVFVVTWDDGPKLMRINGDDENKVKICMVSNKSGLDAIEYQETLLWLP